MTLGLSLSKQNKRFLHYFVQLMLTGTLFASTGCDTGGSTPSIAWVEKHESTQIESMNAADLLVDNNGFVYSLGTEVRSDGTERGLLIKHDSNGVVTDKLIFDASGDSRITANNFAIDPSGDLIVIGRRNNNNNWFVTKIDSTSMTKVWESTWDDGGNKHNAYTISVGPSGNAYVAGFHDQGGTRRFAAVKFNGVTGNIDWTDVQYCCSNGAIENKSRWSSVVVEASGDEIFIVNHGGPNGTGSNPKDQEIRWYNSDRSVIGSQEVDMDSNASNYQLMSHPDGYVLFAGNRGNQAKLLKIDYDSSGVTNISIIFEFDKEFSFSAMTLDKDNAVYIAGENGSGNDLNIYTAKIDESCDSPIDEFDDIVCWDREFNLSMLFSINISFLGIPIIDSYTREDVKDIFVSGDLVYILSTSDTTNAVVDYKHISNIYGYSTDVGVATKRLQLNASNTVAGQLHPLDDSNLFIFGRNAPGSLELAADPEEYLYTHSIKLY